MNFIPPVTEMDDSPMRDASELVFWVLLALTATYFAFSPPLTTGENGPGGVSVSDVSGADLEGEQ